jgi:serine/threonine protein kinase/tetratricopeptide (TPR) repeat protein
LNLAPGVRVGPYEILAGLGAGGMGEVYRARDERLGRDVALKILSGELSQSGEHLRRFEQEARAASALNHPNIITIYDIGSFDSMAYIAMELIEGRDVRSMLGGEAMALRQALRIAVKVADGLAAAHERGIVHRDLKPENVMVSRDGFVKILDFGLAKLVVPFTDLDATLPHTTPGAVFGTVGYMSPEQAAGREIDYRCDQFAFGVMLYEMVTGRLPFSERTAAETLAAIIRTDPRPIENYNDKVPFELTRIIMRLLAKEPEERYASTRDLARDLREVRDRVSNLSEPRHRSDRFLSAPPPKSALIAAVGFAAFIVVAVMVMLFKPDRGETEPAGGPPSVVVLPFRDLTGTPDGQVYTDGLAEMISSRLIEARTIRIIPRFTERARTADPLSVARQVKAAFALRGGVQRVGDSVSVNYALINATSGEVIAGETMQARTSDVFALQDRLVASILAALNIASGTPTASHLSSELSNTKDRESYVETLGLLQRSRDEKSIDQAIVQLERLLLNARDSALVNAQLARALIYKSQLGRRPSLVEQANVYAERARDLDASLPDVHIRLGQIRNMSGRHQEALAEFQKALSLRSDDPDALLGIAVTNDAMGRAADAEAMYKKAIAARPDHPDSYNRYGIFLHERGRSEEALPHFRRFTELNPEASRGFLNLGAAYQALGRFDEARRAYELSIAAEPTGDAYSNLATLEFYLGRYAASVTGFEKAANLTPTNYLIWANLGDAYRWAPGLREKSVPAFEKCVALARESLAVNARDAVAHALVGSSLAKIGRTAEASRAIDTALRIDPTNSLVLYSAALVNLLQQKPDVARTWLERATDAGYPSDYLQRDPEFAELRK